MLLNALSDRDGGMELRLPGAHLDLTEENHQGGTGLGRSRDSGCVLWGLEPEAWVS